MAIYKLFCERVSQRREFKGNSQNNCVCLSGRCSYYLDNPGPVQIEERKVWYEGGDRPEQVVIECGKHIVPRVTGFGRLRYSL